MTWIVVGAALLLAAVAVAGVLRPFGRARAGMLERQSDPLDDERATLLSSLRELEREHREGDLTEADYRALRQETEARAVAVLRALEARSSAGGLAAGLRELRSTAAGNGHGEEPEAGRPPFPALRKRAMAVILAGALGAAAIVPALAGALRNRTAEQPLSGDLAAGTGLELFEQRVEQHPGDLAARLDLAQRYLAVGDAVRAIEQYEAALAIDADNPEALSKLGWLLAVGGRPEEGLQVVQRALASDPDYAEAHYIEGIILMDGLDRPDEAAEAFRAYLAAAPFGSHRAEVQDRLEETASSG